MHALTAGAGGRTIDGVYSLVIVIRTALKLSVKRSLSLLHLRTHDPIRLLITRGSRMIWVLCSCFGGGLRPLRSG